MEHTNIVAIYVKARWLVYNAKDPWHLDCGQRISLLIGEWTIPSSAEYFPGPLLLTWFNLIPSMDK